MNNKIYDVIIIGAGPIGISCGIEAKKSGLSYLILEKGCIVNSIFNFPTNMTFFSTSDKLEIGGVPFISHGNKPTRTEALEYYRRISQSYELNLRLFEEVVTVKKESNEFIIISAKGEYVANNIIVATGFYDWPNYLNIPGEELPKVKHYYDDPHLYASMKVAVIGGGNSGVDAALETYRCGAEVSMIIKKPNLDKGVKYWVLPDIMNRIKEESITAYLSTELIEIKNESLLLKRDGKLFEIDNDIVLAMTGYHANFEFLEGLYFNITDEGVPIYDEITFESNIHHLFLAGVVCGGRETGKWFIENSRYHAKNIIKKIKSY